MVQTMRTLTEVAMSETLQQMSQLVKESLQATQEFWSDDTEDSKLLSLLDVTGEFIYYHLQFCQISMYTHR